MSIDTDIQKEKRKLIKEAKKDGLYENFGQKEVRGLEDKYFDDKYKNNGVFDKIVEFDKWCCSYEG